VGRLTNCNPQEPPQNHVNVCGFWRPAEAPHVGLTFPHGKKSFVSHPRLVTTAQSRRYAQNVHARVSTNERTSFQSRTLVLDCWPRNGVSAHEGLTFLKEAHLGDSGPSRERVRDFCEYLAHEHTDQETRIWPQCARFAIRARS